MLKYFYNNKKNELKYRPNIIEKYCHVQYLSAILSIFMEVGL